MAPLTSNAKRDFEPEAISRVDRHWNAGVYGHVTNIDVSRRVKGHTSVMLRFDRLIMPNGRRASSHAEIVSFTMRRPGKQLTSRTQSKPVTGAGKY